MSKPALGRGLGALLGGGKAPPSAHSAPALAPVIVPAPSGSGSPALPHPPVTGLPAPRPGTAVQRVALARVFPSPLQPRKDFPPESLQDLADSIREQGIVQPLIVRPSGDRFELIAGERRWRAAKLLGLADVPIIERVATDAEVLELALIENLQRENLNPMEEAHGYALLSTQFQFTQEQIAQKVGRGRVVVANALRLLKLAPRTQSAVRAGRLSVGHAKVLLGLADVGLQESAADRVEKDSLTVRQLEELVARWTEPKLKPGTPPPKVVAPRDVHVVDVENRLRERFATKIALKYAAGQGSIELRFASDKELDRLLGLLGLEND